MKPKLKNPYLSRIDKFDIKMSLTTMNLSKAICIDHDLRLMWVDAWSSPKLKKFVYRIAVYFSREFQYDFVQYSEDEQDLTHRAFLIFSRAGDKYYGKDIYRILGGGCFRQRKYQDFPESYALQWIWIHPYMRRKGMLTKAFDQFINQLEQFRVEPPYSVEIKSFLEKGGSTWKIKDDNNSCEYLVIKVSRSSHEMEQDNGHFDHLNNWVPVLS
jgi:RimJ/RimL family protein N-acetyltransferase